jgi:uncharacterized protein (TIGR02588 family)
MARALSHNGKSRSKQHGEHATSRWEWVVASVGGLIVFGIIGYMGWYAVAYDQTPPNLSVVATEIAPSGDSYVVTFKITNHGNTTAADVTVVGLLQKNGETVDKGESHVRYVPTHSEREGGLFFRADPRAFELVLRGEGYSKP